MTDTVRLDQLTVSGASRGGIGTWFRVQPPGLAFDVGHGVPQLSGVRRIFLTHGHLDHAAGVPFLLSQRLMQDLGSTEIYCPREIHAVLEAFIEAGARLEGKEYDFSLHPLEPGDRIPVGSGMTVEAFASEHVAPSLGYHLVQTVGRLRPEFAALTAGELAGLRREGREIEDRGDRLWLSYPGDTSAALLEREPRVFEARVLILECTFIGSESRERAAEYGHMHFDDLRRSAPRFANEKIILHHLSRRSSLEELRRAVDRELPELAPRIHVLGLAGEGVDNER